MAPGSAKHIPTRTHTGGDGRNAQTRPSTSRTTSTSTLPTPTISGATTPLRLHTVQTHPNAADGYGYGYGALEPSELQRALALDVGDEEDEDEEDERDERGAMLRRPQPYAHHGSDWEQLALGAGAGIEAGVGVGDGGEVDDASVEVNGEDTVTTFVWVLVAAAAISGLLFGYDTAAISGMLVIMHDDLGRVLSDWDKELITTSTTLGALLGGLAAGALSDYTGRKMVIALANGVFIAGALIQAACHSVPIMVIGRFVVGLGVGTASCVVPLYIGELAPARIRGRLVTINASLTTLGQVVAYAVGSALQRTPNGWRWIVGLGAVPALVQVSALGWLPESPRILLLQSKTSQARTILAKIYPLATPSQMDHKVHLMHKAVVQSREVNEGRSLVQRLEGLLHVGSNRRALIIACGLQASQQFSGFNTLMYYSATIFATLGFDNATLVGLIIATVNFTFTLVAVKIVDPVGKRTTLLYTIPVMVISLLASASFFRRLTASTGGILVDGATYPRSTSVALLSTMLIYVAGYATGLGNIPWQQGELFKLEVRGLGTSISTAVCWSGNLIVSGTFLTLMKLASPAGAFALYALACAAGWMFVYYLYPETSGLSLEEVSQIFQTDFGVVKSLEMRRDKAEKIFASSTAAAAAHHSHAHVP